MCKRKEYFLTFKFFFFIKLIHIYPGILRKQMYKKNEIIHNPASSRVSHC